MNIVSENGVAKIELTVYEPTHIRPQKGFKYYSPNLNSPEDEPLHYVWDDSKADYRLLISNRVHNTRDEAYQQQQSLAKLIFFIHT